MNDEFEQRVRRDLGALDQLPVSSLSDTRQRTDKRATANAQRRDRVRTIGVLGATIALLAAGVVGLVWARAGDRATGPVAAPSISSPGRTSPSPSAPPVDTGPGVSAPADSTAIDASETTEGANTVPAPDGLGTEASGWADVWGTISPDPRVYDEPADAVSVAVWTGTDVLLVGPAAGLADPSVSPAVAYEPTTDTWRSLASPPTATAGDEIAAWTGTELLMFGGSEDVAIAYDPETDVWRDLASRSGDVAVGHMVGGERGMPYAWDGTELFVWSQIDDSTNSATNTSGPLAYDVDTDTWRALATPPAGFSVRRAAASAWTGTEWLLWGGTGEANGIATEFADGAAYDPTTDTWRMLADSPLSERRATGTWTGTEMLVIAGSSGGSPSGNGEMALDDGAAYDPATDTWRPLRSGIAHPGLQPVWTGEYVLVFFKGTAGVYHPATDEWIDSCCSPESGAGAGRTHVWIGDRAISFNSHDARHGGATFTPPGSPPGTSP